MCHELRLVCCASLRAKAHGTLVLSPRSVQGLHSYDCERCAVSGKRTEEMAEELYETQGHLDPAVVGYSPYGLHLKETEQCAISVVKRPPGPAFCLTTRPSIGSSLCQPSRSAVWLSPCGAQSEVLISVPGKRRERR